MGAGVYNPTEHHGGPNQAGDQSSALMLWPVLIGGRFATIIDNGRRLRIGQPGDAAPANNRLTRKEEVR